MYRIARVRKALKKAVALIALLFVASQAFALNSIMDGYEGDAVTQNINDLERIYRFVDNNFLYDIDHKKVYEAMATAMLDALDDQWSTYISSSESEQYEEMITGKYVGVGILLSKASAQNQREDDDRTLYVQVGSVFNGGPAQAAGIATGDLITRIDGQSVRDKTASECSRMLRGERGTTVQVSVRRGNVDFETSIVRREIDTPTVDSQMLPGGIFYLRINSFTQGTAQQVREEFAKIDFLNSIILDLRDNGGGDVNSSLAVANLFLDGGNVLIRTRNKIAARDRTHYSSVGAIVPIKANMVVLMNGHTASASEILAVALRDNRRAILAGERSYGKGVMQYTSQYKDGVVNVTTAEYVSGLGTRVNKVGLEPDVHVSALKMSDEEVEAAIEAYKSSDARDYVRRNPVFSPEAIEAGIDELAVKYPARRSSLASILLSEYRYVSAQAGAIVAYPEYDPVLSKAIERIEMANECGSSVFDFTDEALGIEWDELSDGGAPDAFPDENPDDDYDGWLDDWADSEALM